MSRVLVTKVCQLERSVVHKICASDIREMGATIWSADLVPFTKVRVAFVVVAGILASSNRHLHRANQHTLIDELISNINVAEFR